MFVKLFFSAMSVAQTLDCIFTPMYNDMQQHSDTDTDIDRAIDAIIADVVTSAINGVIASHTIVSAGKNVPDYTRIDADSGTTTAPKIGATSPEMIDINPMALPDPMIDHNTERDDSITTHNAVAESLITATVDSNTYDNPARKRQATECIGESTSRCTRANKRTRRSNARKNPVVMSLSAPLTATGTTESVVDITTRLEELAKMQALMIQQMLMMHTLTMFQSPVCVYPAVIQQQTQQQ